MLGPLLSNQAYPLPKTGPDEKKMAMKQVPGQGTPGSTVPTSNNTPVPVSGPVPAVASRTGTPQVGTAGISSISPMVNRATGLNQSPSPRSLPNGTLPPPADYPYKEDEENLKKMAIRKTEIIARFKCRQEILGKSSVDLFLCSLGDCLGLPSASVDLISPIPSEIVEHVNGGCKGKNNGAPGQRVKGQDLPDVSIVNNSIVFADSNSPEAKAEPYVIGLNDVASVFRDVYGSTDLSSFSFETKTFAGEGGAKKRKAGDLDNSPDASPASSAIMSESKKLKIDSPEDMYFTAPGEDTKQLLTKSGAMKFSPENKIWDWSFWETS